MISASAHPNVALIKYWGKSHDALRIPATPSLSMPLLAFRTETSIEVARKRDEVILSGQEDKSGRIANWLRTLRGDLGLDMPPLTVRSSSNFPSAAGLASSASGFAALTLAINALLDLDLDMPSLSRLARLGSASAARSVSTGFIALDGRENTHTAWSAQKVLDYDAWPLGVCVAICSHTPKAVSSAAGMNRSRDTSPAYNAWLTGNRQMFERTVNAVTARDFEALASAARWSFFGMLTVMQSSVPPLNYFNESTCAVIQAIKTLQDQGVPVFFTCDAGPHVKCVHLPEYAALVEARIRAVPGVLEAIQACP